ncbi:thiol reductant ABC exporter subunit CydC [Agromyces endophyticus]|uniref:thiol reductant ABC exporter subunit CydC n=1 Tax=Agromyces sp. H17E-10 TaxID=2932244 RepID=UPI001FD5A58C|nr:thiol reductant ABC exporter subunit CydC [Agromyces sp. H17E-10]UOQ89396.1 thiol reductant ABC exporter subunit CydC [Agromyces sp. H17E-10]
MSERTTRTRAVLRTSIPPIGRLLPAVLFGVASGGSTVALLACSAWLIARAAEQPPVLYLSLAIVGVRAFALGRAVFRYLERLTGHDAAFRQLAAIRTGVFERMLPVAPDGVADLRHGELLARFTGDVDELQNVSLRVVQPVVSALVVLAGAVVGVALVSPASAAAVAGCLVIGVGASLVVQHAVASRAERRLAPLRGELQAAVVEHAQSLETLVAFDAAAASRRRIEALGDRLARHARANASAAGAAAALMTAIGGFAVAASLLAGQPLLADGRIDGPTFAMLCLVPLAIAEVAAALPPAMTAWRLAGVSAERVAEAVPGETPAEIPVAPAAPAAAPRAGRPPRLTLVAASAAWPGARGAALSGIDLDLGPGERVLVRGPSGAGKTTLAHVLVRFLAVTGGEYLVDGIDADRLDPAAVRRLVGLVEQSPWLFDEDVRQNLLFARDTASDDELVDVLERVGLGDWLAERGGLDAEVGERGALVSGGQAQRIALARAMLAGFPVLVLDEPTANVDREQADALLADLLGAAGDDRTVVVISHTPVDPALVDRVVSIADGRLTEADRAPSAAHAAP